VLLDGMGLKPPKRDKKQKTARPSVSGKKLAVLYGGNPWVDEFVAWKKLEKLGGYLRDWIERAHEGNLYGRFDQSGTATGRLAAREPNLQQVATESDIRDLFRGDLVIGDYGGLEVRISAHFSHDPVMMEIFNGGGDLYGTLAAEAWGGEPTKANPNRPLMKVVMLGSQYGAAGETLAFIMSLAGIPTTPAKADGFLRDLKKTLPRMFAWRQEVIAQAEKDGYVETLAGRQRQLVGIKSADWQKKGTAERQAVSTKVQGSAADIVRRAMLAARMAISPEVARICLQVHDEILWKRGPEWEADVFPQLVDICQFGHGFELDVPLTFEAKIAQSWGEKDGQIHSGAYEHLNAGGIQ
jgi:DNA polymerase-1